MNSVSLFFSRDLQTSSLSTASYIRIFINVSLESKDLSLFTLPIYAMKMHYSDGPQKHCMYKENSLEPLGNCFQNEEEDF